MRLGMHGSAYFNKDAVYPHTATTGQLCLQIAENFQGSEIDVVIAPEVGGIILSQWVAHHLSILCGREVLSVYAERSEAVMWKVDSSDTLFQVNGKSLDVAEGDEIFVRKPGFVIKRGYDKLVRGKRVLVVEDVLTTGASAKAVVQAAKRVGGSVVGVAALCNRGEVTSSNLDADELFHLLSFTLDAWDEDECPLCRDQVPINTDVGKGKDFLARKQAKE